MIVEYPNPAQCCSHVSVPRIANDLHCDTLSSASQIQQTGAGVGDGVVVVGDSVVVVGFDVVVTIVVTVVGSDVVVTTVVGGTVVVVVIDDDGQTVVALNVIDVK